MSESDVNSFSDDSLETECRMFCFKVKEKGEKSKLKENGGIIVDRATRETVTKQSVAQHRNNLPTKKDDTAKIDLEEEKQNMIDRQIVNLKVPFYSGDMRLCDVYRMKKRFNDSLIKEEKEKEKFDSRIQEEHSYSLPCTYLTRGGASKPRLQYCQTGPMKPVEELIGTAHASAKGLTQIGKLPLRKTSKISGIPTKSCTGTKDKTSTKLPSSCSYVSSAGNVNNRVHIDATKSCIETKKKCTSYLQEHRARKYTGMENNTHLETVKPLESSKISLVCNNQSALVSNKNECSEEESTFYQNIINGVLDLELMKMELRCDGIDSEVGCEDKLKSSSSTMIQSQENARGIPHVSK